ncbi:MAG: branched-chain amino acid ABC transporter substrate-binding protein [Proteobacteria bacterium]|nr:branched-chain amino acid ABC transporter substrate-binding protein [Pseudomonadota bacterium]
MKRLIRRACVTLVMAAAAFTLRPAVAADPIKIAYIDPFSGPFASGGDEFLKVFAYIIQKVNADGGALGRKFEIVPFDDKLQPAEALIALKSATDQNIPFIMQCTGSNVGAALLEGVSKHNARNPDNRVLYLNCGALATELTNEKCDFWQFRFAGNVEMRAAARIKSLPPSIKKVYLLNQDYLFGQSVQRDTRKYLQEVRPDIQIVGDELMPFGKVQDFAPYVEKIRASGAQSVITGNYNRDLNLLIKASVDAGLDVRFDTYLAHLIGGPTAIGTAGDGRLSTVTEFHPNVPAELNKPDAETFSNGWRANHDTDFSQVPFLTMFQMLARAIDKAGSTDALKVAQALEGMTATDLVGFPVEMRKDDHQLLMPFYASTFTKRVKYDSEKTGLGWKTDFIASTKDLTLPTICKMKRPAS